MATDDPNRQNPSTENQETVVFKGAPELTAGTLLNGRYRLIRQLDHGGFGAVYLAHDTQMHDRPVVVKIQIDQRIDDPWFERKFSEEVRALSMIDHPGVVVAIDSGRTPDGKPFLVMQYVDGVTLRTVMNAEGMPLERAAEILKQVGHALGAAHDRGILHRDLKPENLMLQTSTAAGERVRLIDFGIATVADVENKYQTSTRVSGTVLYMAPEQLLGQPSALTDIYALGLIAYEMVTGRRPFLADNPVQLAALQRSGVRVRPSDLRPNLPRAAERLILKSLEYDPSKRPANARAFGDDLHSTILNAGATTIHPTARPGQKIGSKVTAIGASAAVALVLAGVAYYKLRTRPESPKANAPKTELVARSASYDPAVELAFWGSVKNSSDPRLYREYLAKYPQGRFESVAKLKLEILARSASKKPEDAEADSTDETREQEVESELWKAYARTGDPQLGQEYLDTYPHGRFASLARRKLHSPANKPQSGIVPGLENMPIPVIPDLGKLTNGKSAVPIEVTEWTALKNAKDAQPYQDYLAKYPNGMFAELARMKIAAFEKSAGK